MRLTPEQYKTITNAKKMRHTPSKTTKPSPCSTGASSTPKNALNWLEKDIQAYVVGCLTKYGFAYAGSMEGVYFGREKGQRGGKMIGQGMKRGEPDLRIYLKGGICLFIELKRKGEKPKPHQIARHELLRGLGFQVYVVAEGTGQAAWGVIKKHIDAVLNVGDTGGA